eukprot:g40196.t1
MVENVTSLGVMITNNLSWSTHITTPAKEAQQHLYFLRRLRKFCTSIKTLTNCYKCTVESILSGCITDCFGHCSSQDCRKLQRVVNTAQTIAQTNFPSVDFIFTSPSLGRVTNIIKDSSHPGYTLFHPLPLGRSSCNTVPCTLFCYPDALVQYNLPLKH